MKTENTNYSHQTSQSPIILNGKIEFASMRAGFGEGLVIAGKHDKNVVVLCADLIESTGVLAFKKEFPDRFIEIGVAEQNLVTVASGMAAMGKIPFAASYAVFSPGRNWEQIRTTICYNDRPVKIVGSHAGVSVGADGGSHQALEDIALMRALPRMTVISPCDAIEASKAAIAAAKINSPVYMRLSREKVPTITSKESEFKIGKANIVFRSTKSSVSGKNKLDVAIISTGSMVYHAIEAARELDKNGKSVAVMNLSTIKPLDGDAIISLANESGAVVTVEEHQIAGGMGSAVAECLAMHKPVPIEFVGVRDAFGQSGTSEELFRHYGLTKDDIYSAAHKVMLRK